MLSNIACVINARLARVFARPHRAVICAHLPRDGSDSVPGFFCAAAAKCDSSRRATMSTDIDIAILQISAKPGTRRAPLPDYGGELAGDGAAGVFSKLFDKEKSRRREKNNMWIFGVEVIFKAT